MFDQLSTVLETTTMTAAEMTHSLCELGNGSMGDGILSVFNGGIQLGILGGFPVGWEKGWKSGHTKGLLTGAAVVASGAAIVSLCVWGVRKRKAKKLACENASDSLNTTLENDGLTEENNEES